MLIRRLCTDHLPEKNDGCVSSITQLHRMLFFHLSSDQWRQYGKYFWRFSLILQNWTAPSSSRCTWFPWRRRWSISSIVHNRRANIPLVQHRSTFFSQQELFLGKSRQVLFFVVLLWPLIGMQNPSHPISTHILRAETSGISDSWLFKFITNLFGPWEILTQKWELSLFTEIYNSDLNSVLYRATNRLQFPIRVQFWCSLGSILLVVMLLRLLVECTHDRPLHLWIVRILQCFSSWNTVRLQL